MRFSTHPPPQRYMAYLYLCNLLGELQSVTIAVTSCRCRVCVCCSGAEVVYNPRFDVDSLQVTAYMLIALSFPLNMLPRDWHSRLSASKQWLCLRNTVASSGEEGSAGSTQA